MARRQQFGRTFQLLRLLSRPGGASLSELVEELGVTRRTLYRDLESLQDCGVPLFDGFEGIAKRWHVPPTYLASGGTLPTLDELLALHAIRAEILQAAGGAFAAPIEAMLARVRSGVPQVLLDRADQVRDQVRAAPRPVPWRSAAGIAPTLLSALEGGHVLRLDYRSRGGGLRPRDVEPWGLASRGAGLYLVGRDVNADAVRVYLVTRIEAAERTGKRFAPPEGFDVESHFGANFGVHGGEVERVVVRFAASVASYVRERKWHRSQVLRAAPGGGVTLTMDVAGRVEVKSWVQSFGSAATLLAPADLAAEIAREAEAVAARWAAGQRGARRPAPRPQRPVARRATRDRR